MRNTAFAALAFRETLLDIIQQEQFIQNLLRRSLFRHLLDSFQNKLPVAHNTKTMRRQNRERKPNLFHTAIGALMAGCGS